MRARIQRWGNSLAVRIPRAFAAETGMRDGSAVEMTVVDGTLVLTPEPEAIPTLDELLAGVTDDNIHDEIDAGPAVGVEARFAARNPAP